MMNLKCLNLSKYDISVKGDVYSHRTNSFLTGAVAHHGYRFFTLIDDQGVVVRKYAHRLVARAFIDNDLNLRYVNHIDGDKLNNDKNNLEWCTASENNIHAYNTNLSKGKHSENGVYLKGEYNESSETDCWVEEDVILVCNLISEGYRDVDISRITELPRRIVNKIRHNEFDQYSFIIDKYEFNFTKEVRLSPEKVLDVCRKLEQGMTIVDICKDLNLNRKQVGNIKNRKTFKNISKSFIW